MMGTTGIDEENEATCKQSVKKVNDSNAEVTKRYHLGELQNRCVVRPSGSKAAATAARKDSKDAKLQNAIGVTKMTLATTWDETATRPTATQLGHVTDIDEDDGEHLVWVSEYVNDIYSYLFKLEMQQPITKNHLRDQMEIRPKMRAILIDWLNEAHSKFHLLAETFQLAVANIDCYLQTVKDTKKSQLMLVGITALFIAAKYEHHFPPSMSDLIDITDNNYNGEEIRQMEVKICKMLNFNLSRPLPIDFLRRFSKAAAAPKIHYIMSKYFLELAMVEYNMCHYRPSEIAAASLLLSLNILKENSNEEATGLHAKYWSSTLEWYSRYSAEQLRPIVKNLAGIVRNAGSAKLTAVYQKYQATKFQGVSMRPELYGILMDSIVCSKD